MFTRGQKVIVRPQMPGLEDIAGKSATVHHKACDNSFYIEVDTMGERLYIDGSEIKSVEEDELIWKYTDH